MAEVIGRHDLGATRNILIRDYKMVPNTNMIGVNKVKMPPAPRYHEKASTICVEQLGVEL